MNDSKNWIFIIGVVVILFSGINVSAEFGTDIRVNDDPDYCGQGIGPEKTSVIVKGNEIYAVWQDGRNSPKFQRTDIYFAKGTIDDEGNVTFSENVMVNDIPESPLGDRASAPAMAVGDDGTIFVVWTDMRNVENQLQGVDIYLARSIDGGKNFEANQLIGSTKGGSGSASIAVAGSYVYVVYGHCCDPANDVINLVVSSDNGQSFGDIQTIYIPAENVNVTGSGQPTIAAEDNYVYVAFQITTTDHAGEVMLMISSNFGSSFSEPKKINDDEGENYQAAISLSVSEEHVYLVWHDMRTPGHPGIFAAVSHDQGSTFESNLLVAEMGGFPVPAISVNGENAAITYCGGNESIYGVVVLVRVSQDYGTTWSNQLIVSDIDVSRSGIGPSAVSLSDKGMGILWIDGRGGQPTGSDVYFDWYALDENGGEIPYIEILVVTAALGVAGISFKILKK